MSQNSVPIRVAIRFIVRRRQWYLGDARLVCEEIPIRTSPGLVAIPFMPLALGLNENALTSRIVLRIDTLGDFDPVFAGMTTSTRNERIHPRYGFDPMKPGETSREFKVLFSFGNHVTEITNADPWQMRDEWFLLKKNPQSALDFANQWGPFDDSAMLYEIDNGRSSPLLGHGPLPFPRESDKASARPGLIVLEDFWAELDRYRVDLPSTTAKQWLPRHKNPLGGLSSILEAPFVVTTPQDCSQAIRDTVTLDLIRGVRFRKCGLRRLDGERDCPNIFPLKSRHERVFCAHKHAHLDLLRLQREEAKKQKDRDARAATKAVKTSREPRSPRTQGG